MIQKGVKEFLTITVNLVNSKNLRQLGWYYSTDSQKYKICAIIINFYLAECLLSTYLKEGF